MRDRLRQWTARAKAGASLEVLRAALLQIKLDAPASRLGSRRFSSLIGDVVEELAALGNQAADAWLADWPLLRLNEQVERLLGLISRMLHRHEVSGREEVLRAKRFIQEKLAERLTLQQVSEHVGLSPNYFSALFKKEEQIGLVDYINERKIEMAKDLLHNRNYSNLELSERVGIGSERYFCTLFRQYAGTTPQKYRKQLKSGR